MIRKKRLPILGVKTRDNAHSSCAAFSGGFLQKVDGLDHITASQREKRQIKRDKRICAALDALEYKGGVVRRLPDSRVLATRAQEAEIDEWLRLTWIVGSLEIFDSGVDGAVVHQADAVIWSFLVNKGLRGRRKKHPRSRRID